MIEHMTAVELIARREHDYELDTPGKLADAVGVSEEQMKRIMRGKNKIGIKAMRGLVRALDLAPGVIERSVRK